LGEIKGREFCGVAELSGRIWTSGGYDYRSGGTTAVVVYGLYLSNGLWMAVLWCCERTDSGHA
jgi:hypothetical protein